MERWRWDRWERIGISIGEIWGTKEEESSSNQCRDSNNRRNKPIFMMHHYYIRNQLLIDSKANQQNQQIPRHVSKTTDSTPTHLCMLIKLNKLQ